MISFDTKHSVGQKGEELAAKYLVNLGYKILARNWRFKNHHEIDVIAETKEREIVIVEVRTHETTRGYQPFESIDKAKIQQVFSAAQYFIREKHLENRPVRLDVVSVILENNLIEHFTSIDVPLTYA